MKEKLKNPAQMKEHWTMDVSKTVFVEGDGKTPSDKAFLPTPGRMRPTPHVKVNECDH